MMECDGLPSTVKAKLKGKPKRKKGQYYAYLTYEDHYKYAGEYYTINSKSSGCYTSILRKIIERMLAIREQYGRFLMVVFELHHPQFEGDSNMVSAYMKSVRAYVKSRYQMPDSAFVWVREKEQAKGQHYHVTLLVDGDKVRNSLGEHGLSDSLKEIWKRKGGSIHHSAYHFVDDDLSFNEAFKHASYMAKGRGKGYQPKGARNLGCSHLKKKLIPELDYQNV